MDVEKLDLASLKSVRECAQRLLDKEDKIDILINNAGELFYCKLVKTLPHIVIQFKTAIYFIYFYR